MDTPAAKLKLSAPVLLHRPKTQRVKCQNVPESPQVSSREFSKCRLSSFEQASSWPAIPLCNVSLSVSLSASAIPFESVSLHLPFFSFPSLFCGLYCTLPSLTSPGRRSREERFPVPLLSNLNVDLFLKSEGIEFS